jgi:hypothetical protein
VHYDKDSVFNPRKTFNSFSFGVSRESMKKIHIQEIEKRAEQEKTPAPDSYNLP